jgi:hypothetical protein
MKNENKSYYKNRIKDFYTASGKLKNRIEDDEEDPDLLLDPEDENEEDDRDDDF